MRPKHRNYQPESMSFLMGFMGPKGDVGYQMFVDNDKANKIINHLLSKGKEIEFAQLGLDGDWELNSETIYTGDEIELYDLHESSQWATPILLVTYSDGSNEAYECWYRQIDVEVKSEDDTKLLN